MAHSKRLSFSSTSESTRMVIPTLPNVHSEQWIKDWQGVYARDHMDSRIVSVDAETSVEEACEVLLSEDILCLAVKSPETADSSSPTYLGLFDFSDVNAFLTLAATRHTLLPDDLRENPRVDKIVSAARAGRVPIHLVSNLSEKNPLETLPHDATIISLLEVFSRGSHRVLIQSPFPALDYIGMVSDRRLLSWFSSYERETPSLQQFFSNPLQALSLPSLNLYSSVIAAKSTWTVLDAMKLMSEEGVGSAAVLDEDTGALLSAVSVTDIGKIVVPSQSNHILSTPLHQFISQIKDPDGLTDGADKCPVYSVLPTNTLAYTIQKLLATNARRLFVTEEEFSGSASPVVSSNSPGTLSGIVSVVDILSLFARLANIPDVDPTRMQRHRRASSSSSQSSRSERDLALSRSNSRTSTKRSPSLRTTNPGPPIGCAADSPCSSISITDSFQWTEKPAKKDG